METAVVIRDAILSASFQGLLDRLASLDLLKYACSGQILAQLMNWETMLKKIDAVLDDAEEKQMTNQLVKIWVNDLRDLAYDVEDILDEFATEALRHKLEVETPNPISKVRKLIPTFFAKVNPCTIKFNAEMITKIEGITSKLQKFAEEKDRLNLKDNARGSTSQVRGHFTTSLVNEAKIYGREKDRKAILELLKAEVTDGEISVIPIIGMGGIGKTTLAQLIFKDVSLEFDFKAWVSVGEVFCVFRMTKTILQSIGEDINATDLNLLQMKLMEKLTGKKFFIVLDDVWNESYEDWTIFYGPLEAGAPGSKIVVTSRNEGVSSMMGTVPTYHLKELSCSDCMSVFTYHALGAKDFGAQLHLEEVGQLIVKKCQGLPLAAKVLGGLLRGKRNRFMWENVLNSKLWDLPKESRILPALRLSYHHLPSHLKRCFTYCAIFPKDFEFDEDELVLMWMAEGLLQPSGENKQIKDLGRGYFRDLLSRSFFQQSGGNKSRYVMHHLMSDLARYIGGEICYCLDDKLEGAISCEKVRYSSFIRCRYDVSQRFEVFSKMRSLRTFVAVPTYVSSYRFHYLSSNVLCDLVPKLKQLRVLSLASYCLVEVPNSIAALKHLRYLNLSYTNIRRLPESLSELFNLQTLRLHSCLRLVKLPNGISNLINLEYLDITGTVSLQEMPPHIGNLVNLRMLPKFIVAIGNGYGLRELMKISYLQGHLLITGLQNVVDIRDADLAFLQKKQGLDELMLEWDDFHDSRNERDELQVLNSLQPNQNLASLSIRSYGGTKFPSWLGDPMFSNMVQLQLHNCQKIMSLPPLGQLPLLRVLSLVGMDGIKEVGSEFFGDSSPSVKNFASLETLNMENMLGWKQWSCFDALNEEDAGIFPNLHQLTVRNCPNLVGELPTLLLSLKELQIHLCPQLTKLPKMLPSLCELNIEECHKTTLKSIPYLTCLTVLKIKRISGLTSLHPITHSLVALEDLQITECSDLTYLWQDGTHLDKLACLKNLEVFHCEMLVSLVEEGGRLPDNLELLSIKVCHNLENLPTGLNSLTSLKYLRINDCPKLVSLAAIGLPCNLEVLRIKYCSNLEHLPNGLQSLTSLKDLHIVSCPKLMSFPKKGLPYSLKSFEIRNCESLVFLPKGILRDSNYSNETYYLERFDIEGCSSLLSLSTSQFPDSLKTLSIRNCTTQLLKSLGNGLWHLTELLIVDCPELESFPEMGFPIPTLINLRIYSCENLTSLPNQMQNLVSLQILEIYSCQGLLSFPEEGLSPNLARLMICHCKNLTQPISQWRLHRLTSLRELTVDTTSPCTDLVVSFPDEDGLVLPTSLTDLCICGLKNLKSMSKGLHSLMSLQTLCIESCPKLQSLPKEGLPANLGSLVIKSCSLLKEQCLKEKGDYWPIISHIPCLQIE